MKNLFIIFLALTGCANTNIEKQYYLDEIQNLEYQLLVYESFEIDNGINKLEAFWLALHFSSTNIEGCGIVGYPIDAGKFWHVKPTTQSYDIDGYIKINKNTGLIIYKNKKATSHKMLEQILQGIRNSLEYNKSFQPTAGAAG